MARLLLLTGQGKRLEALLESIESDEDRFLCEATIALEANDLNACERILHRVLAINAENQDALTLEMMVKMARGERIDSGLLGRLRDPATAVAEAWNYSTDKKWLDVAKLDKRLEQATPRDLCYRRAVQARVRWRIDSNQAELAAEAIRLLQESVPLNRHVIFLRPRARAGLLTGNNAVVVGTVERVADFYRVQKNKSSREQIQKAVLQSESLLDGIVDPAETLKPRIERTRQHLRDLLR